MKKAFHYALHTGLFIALPLLAFSGCTEASRIAQSIGESATATMPPVGPDGIVDATTFWTTWGVTLLAHEGRKILRDVLGKRKSRRKDDE